MLGSIVIRYLQNGNICMKEDFKFSRYRFLFRFFKDLNMHFAILDIEEKTDEHGSYTVSNFDRKIKWKFP